MCPKFVFYSSKFVKTGEFHSSILNNLEPLTIHYIRTITNTPKSCPHISFVLLLTVEITWLMSCNDHFLLLSTVDYENNMCIIKRLRKGIETDMPPTAIYSV